MICAAIDSPWRGSPVGWGWPATVEPGRRAIKAGVAASMPQDAAKGSGIGVRESGELPILNPDP